MFLSFASWSGELKVTVENIKREGVLYMAVYDDKDVFESDRGENSEQRPGIVGLIKAVEAGRKRVLLS